MENIIELKNVSFSYENNNKTLDNISISFKKGEKVCILGNNGAGKTTFFLMCNGVLKPDCGNILHFGKPIKYVKKELINLRKSVGIVFQDPDNQIIASCVENEISFGPMNLKLPLDEVSKRIENTLESLNLNHLRKRLTHTLSGGEKKRVSIADILVMKPDIIFLDEPTSSLDPQNVKLLEDILDLLHKNGTTIVISTHDIDFAYKFCDRSVVFSNGNILADGDSNSIFNDDDLIEKSGIRKPILFEISKLLDKNNIKLDLKS